MEANIESIGQYINDIIWKFKVPVCCKIDGIYCIQNCGW
jgi:hypothetical protein